MMVEVDDGFSSEQELQHQELKIYDQKEDTSHNNHKQEVKFKLPPPAQLKGKSYSLYPDILTGWSPKIQLPSPIPIIFDNEYLDNFIKCVHNHQTPKLCYLGPRYENTFYSWLDHQFRFPYSHIKIPDNIKYTNRLFNGQNPHISDRILHFDSFFESGNLDCAIQVSPHEYQLFIRVDSNTQGHLQWFNFKISNLEKDVKYKLHICNFQKNKSLYTRGMKPYIYSSKKYEKERIGWQQGGQHVHYHRQLLKSAQALNINFHKSYRLSFEYTTEYHHDQIQIAYCIPYTYSELCHFLDKLSHDNKSYLKVAKLCTSLGGLEVPLLIVHDKNTCQTSQTNSTSPQKSKAEIMKKCIIISGRAHPGESNGSFMMHGFIEFILGDSKIAEYLRKYVVFKIIPMLNPDGVALGNYRTGLSGRDFNRQFRNPDPIIFPEVHAIRKLVAETKQVFKQNLLMFLDFHGHSIKKNVFMYGPQFPIIDRNYYQCRIFPKLLGNRTEMFRYYSCIFKVSQFKQSTARAVLLRKLNIPMAFTIEASNGSYYDHQLLKDIAFGESSWRKMGSIVGQAIEQYTNLIIKSQQMRNEKMLMKQKYKRQNRYLHRGLFRKDKVRSAHHMQYEMSILPNIQDQKIKMLLDEIKKAQQAKQQQKISDDQVSQGSSDQQGEADDLSPTRKNFLYKIIKNKKLKALAKCKFTPEQIKQHRFITNEDQNNHQNQISQSPDKSTNCIITNKQKRKSFIERNRRKIIKCQIPRQKQTARIVNFSFGLSPPVKDLSIDQRSSVPNKINLIDGYSIPKNDDAQYQPIFNKNEINDYTTFRNTFTTAIRDKVQYRIENKLQTVYISKNPRRLEEYKLRKIGNKSFKL